MRLAFASCMYLADNSTQDVWNQLLKRHQETKIDHLLLLGDQVYTGFGFSDANRKPQRTWPQQQFLDTLYKEYKAQFEVPSFKALLRAMAASGGTVQITWDDHDFGYNNAFGNDVAFAANKPISSALFTQFLTACRNPNGLYPAAPSVAIASGATKPAIDLTTLLGTFGGKAVSLVMVDARWDCDDPKQAAPKNLFSAVQRAQIQTALNAPNSLVILANGRPYARGGFSKQMWTVFSDGTALVNQFATTRNVIGLAGDIHKNLVIERDGWYEVFSSGAAKGKKENAGLLDLNTTNAVVELFCKGGERDIQIVIPLATVGTPNFGKGATLNKGVNNPAAALDEPAMLDGKAYTGAAFRNGYLVTNRILTRDGAGDLCDTGGIGTANLHYLYTEVPWSERDRFANWQEVSEAEFLENVVQETAEREPDYPIGATNLAQRRHISVVLHGFNNGLAHAETNMRNLAERCYETVDPRALGQVISFDWAAGHVSIPFPWKLKALYAEDRTRAAASAPQLQSFLTKLRGKIDAAQAIRNAITGVAGPNRVQLSVVANSLGNYIVQEAFQAHAGAAVADRWVMAAADVDRKLFTSAVAPNLAAFASKIDIFYTKKDKVLSLAADNCYNHEARMGYGTPETGGLTNARAIDITDWVKQYDGLSAHHALYQNPALPSGGGEIDEQVAPDNIYGTNFVKVMRGEL